MRNALNLKPGMNVLECGCGTGIFTRELAKTGANITSVDISSDLLKIARTECCARNINFIQGNLEEPIFLEDDSFDAVCGVSILHHLDVTKALNALKRKLKQGAVFAFSEPNISNPINKYYFFVKDAEKRKKRGTSMNEMAFKKNELYSYFSNTGFNVCSLAYRDFLHPSVPIVFIPLVDMLGKIFENIPYLKCISGSLWISGNIYKNEGK